MAIGLPRATRGPKPAAPEPTTPPAPAGDVLARAGRIADAATADAERQAAARAPLESRRAALGRGLDALRAEVAALEGEQGALRQQLATADALTEAGVPEPID